MVKTTRLKLPFNLRRQSKLSAQHHSEYEAADRLCIRPRAEWRFQPGLYPILDSIGAVPPSVQNRDEAGVPDRARPIDALSLQVAPIVKHPRVPIDARAVQLHHDLHTITGAEIQRVEQSALLRVVQKLRKTCPSAVGLRVYR